MYGIDFKNFICRENMDNVIIIIEIKSTYIHYVCDMYN